jgi:hypothetical protein
MSKFTLARAFFAGVFALLIAGGCTARADPESAFPDKVRTQVRLRAGPAREKTRIVHYAEDKKTPLWAEVELTNGHTRNVYYGNNVMTRSEEFYKPADGGGLFLKRLYMPDGRNLQAEEQRLPDGTVVMQGERLADGTYSRNFFGDKHQLLRHLLLDKEGQTLGEEIYYASGSLKQKTTRKDDIVTVDSFDEAGFPTLTESSDRYGYNKTRILYFTGSKQIRVKSELASDRSTVVIYRTDGTVEEDWVRNNQTLVIQHWDKLSHVVWRQNLLRYRYRLGAPSRLSDWRIFSTEDVNPKGIVIRRILFDPDGAPQVVYFPTETATETAFEGLVKTLRKNGTVDVVKSHNKDGSEVVKEQHTAEENIRVPIDPAFMRMPTEDYSFAPLQMGMFDYGR